MIRWRCLLCTYRILGILFWDWLYHGVYQVSRHVGPDIPRDKVSPKNKMSNITNLVCYTYLHWFFNTECQYIFGKQTGYIFQSPKTIKTWTTNITLHWINGIIRNYKCIFNKLNAVFILKTAAWTKNITTVNSVRNTWSIQQTPMFHGCTITNIQNVEPWKTFDVMGPHQGFIYM